VTLVANRQSVQDFQRPLPLVLHLYPTLRMQHRRQLDLTTDGNIESLYANLIKSLLPKTAYFGKANLEFKPTFAPTPTAFVSSLRILPLARCLPAL
jgi:hypothetical protein